jgi:hypothetical protein
MSLKFNPTTSELDLVGSSAPVETDPLSIHKDGSSTTTEIIPFADGIKVGADYNLTQTTFDTYSWLTIAETGDQGYGAIDLRNAFILAEEFDFNDAWYGTKGSISGQGIAWSLDILGHTYDAAIDVQQETMPKTGLSVQYRGVLNSFLGYENSDNYMQYLINTNFNIGYTINRDKLYKLLI